MCSVFPLSLSLFVVSLSLAPLVSQRGAPRSVKHHTLYCYLFWLSLGHNYINESCETLLALAGSTGARRFLETRVRLGFSERPAWVRVRSSGGNAFIHSSEKFENNEISRTNYYSCCWCFTLRWPKESIVRRLCISSHLLNFNKFFLLSSLPFFASALLLRRLELELAKHFREQDLFSMCIANNSSGSFPSRSPIRDGRSKTTRITAERRRAENTST